MKTKFTYLLLVIFIGLCLFSVKCFGEKSTVVDRLSFEISKSKTWTINSTEKQNIYEKFNYVVVIYLKYNYGFDLEPGSELYEKVKNLIPKENQTSSNIPIYERKFNNDKDAYEIRIYTENVELAQEAVKTIISWLDNQAKLRQEEHQKDLERKKENKLELEKEIKSLTEQKENTDKQIVNNSKEVQCRNEDDAQNYIYEITKYLRLVEIEIIGVKAKLEQIQQQNDKMEIKDQEFKDEVSELLFKLRITQEIELAGAMARKQSSQSLLDKISALLSLYEQSGNIENSLQDKKRKLSIFDETIQSYEESVVSPTFMLKPIELTENKIVIYPITVNQ
ncbi:MAG: hypothetical protein JXA96_09750 [Sedimentisphaerales bacterium]|nr:hypothetical protein [Sedimentisphaerales bacterium]